MRARSLTAFLSCLSRKSHTLVLDFPIMKMRVLFKHLDKSSGAIKTIEFKPFDRYDSVTQTKVLNDIISMIDKKCVTESIFQIETFIEHEVTELSMF